MEVEGPGSVGEGDGSHGRSDQVVERVSACVGRGSEEHSCRPTERPCPVTVALPSVEEGTIDVKN